MNEIEVQPASTEHEVQSALELATSVFGDETEIPTYGMYKSHSWLKDPSFEPSRLILAYKSGGGLCGMVRVVPRTIYRGEQAFSVAGISSVCLSKETRGKGLSYDLIKRTLAHCQAQGFDLAVLFARRAADHYYPRFGFRGIASYCQVSVSKERLYSSGNLLMKEADSQLNGFYNYVYNKCYGKTFGRIARSPSYWTFLLDRIRFIPALRFSTLWMSGSPAGYVLWSAKAIHEIAFIDDIPMRNLVSLLSLNINLERSDTLTIEITPQHLFVPAAYQIDMTISFRECTYGGHMACILNSQAVFDRLSVRAPKAAERFHSLLEHELLSHRDTCRLMGAWSPTETEFFDDHPLAFNISVADHF